jgi:hypothetical protein
MRDSTIRSRFRRQIILFAPAAFSASILRAQNTGRGQTSTRPASDQPRPISLQGSVEDVDGKAFQNTDDKALRNAEDKPYRSSDDKSKDVRLPNGKSQTDEILKDDYAKNLKDARDLTGLARGLEEDLEKNEAFVFSLTTLKKLDDMERLTKRIRSRMKRY